MNKKNVVHVCLAGLLILIGVIIESNGGGNFGKIIAWTALPYGGWILLRMIAQFASPIIASKRDKSAKSNARSEMLEIKSLYDQGLLTKDEFDLKAAELKKIFL